MALPPEMGSFAQDFIGVKRNGFTVSIDQDTMKRLSLCFLLFLPTVLTAQVFDSVSEIATPVGINAMEPALFGIADGSIIMSWTEPDGTDFAVKTATFQGGNWSRPVTITTSNNLFVNWADFPTIAAFNDGTLAVSWLQENTNIPYAYDINIALSSDAGQTWGSPIVPHDDQSTR